MSVKYDLYQNPPSEKGEGGYHVRLKSSGTMTTRHLAKEIEHATSLTASDVRSVFEALSHLMRHNLSEGWRIHVEGLGYFSLKASAPVADNPKAMRAEQVRVKGIDFLPERDFLASLAGVTEFERSRVKVHSARRTMDELKAELDDYFTDHAFITRASFELLCGLTRATAINRLNRLVDEGFLRKEGVANAPIYSRNE